MPLGDSGVGSHSLGLALWAMVMMAMNDKHRSIVSLDHVCRLNHWWSRFDDNSQAVYRNFLSAQEECQLPPGGMNVRVPGDYEA